MDPQQAQRLIQTQPQKADVQAQKWGTFAGQHPEVGHFVLKQEFDAWARTHGISDASVWFGKEVQEAYFHLRQQHEEEQLETQAHVDHSNIPTGLAMLGFLAAAFARERPKIIEEDADFKRILKEKAKTWLDHHPDKDITSKEWVDYRYGSLENPSAPTIYEEAEKEFREDARFTKRVELYDKERKTVYKNLDEDPVIISQRLRIDHHAELLYGHRKKQDPAVKKEDVVEKVKAYHWEKFVEKNEDKAKAYAEKHEGIKSAVLRIEEKKKQTVAPKIETKAVIQPITPKPPFFPQSFSQKSPYPLPISEPKPFFSLPTTQAPQYTQRVGGPLVRPPRRIPSLGGLGRITNPLSLGNSLARQAALRLIFMIAGPMLIVLLFTFIIVIGIGPATIGEASPETGSGALGYTILFRDTSILPTDPDAAKEAVKKEFPQAQLQYWDKIIEQSIINGWNPAFVLALWIEETGASHYTVTRNGGGGGGPPHSIGHLGCALWEEQTIDESLSCLFGSKNIFSSLTSDQFEKFMCEYGGIAPRTPPCIFETPSFPAKIKKYYLILVPSGNGLTNIARGQIAPPANTDPQLLALDILKTFGIAMDAKFDYNYLKWAWEKLWDASNTNFLSLVRGPNNRTITVLRNDSLINAQIDCNIISIRGVSRASGQPYPESLFKVVFIHELSHIIEQENCNPSSRKDELAQIIAQEGYLTSYSENGCVDGINKLNEDYAETVAYYLNQEFNEQSLGLGLACEPKDARKPYQRNKPLHQKFAEELLGKLASPTTTNIAQISCPVKGGGATWIGSFQADPINGHCGSAYNAKLSDPNDRCQGNTRRGKSLDIIASGRQGSDIELPTINGQKVLWTLEPNPIPLSTKDCFKEEIINPQGLGGGCGTGYVFNADLGGGKNWILHLLHMGPSSLQPGQSYPSGTIVGKSEAVHVHISMGQDINDTRSQDEPGWKSVDTELKLCQN